MPLAVLVAALVVAVPGIAHAQAEDLDPRVLILPVEGDAPRSLGDLGSAVADAMARGAARITPTVARATASLADTAVIVGCEPEEGACLDAVAAALNVDQLLIATMAPSGEDATVDVTALTREAEPVRRSFTIRVASRDADLAAIEEATPEMLEAGEARKREPKIIEVVKPPQDPEPDPVPPPPEGRRSVTPLVIAGAGGALVVAGGVFWGLAASTQGQIDDAPTDSAADLDRLVTLEDQARQRALIGNVLVIGGAVVAAAGATWYLLDRRRERPVHAAPLVVPGGGGVAIGGTW